DVWAGTTLKALGALLFEKGYAMKNLGDINEQTLAGAISTGTHGTGTQLGNIPSQVRAVTLLTAEGELMEISPESRSEERRVGKECRSSWKWHDLEKKGR